MPARRFAVVVALCAMQPSSALYLACAARPCATHIYRHAAPHMQWGRNSWSTRQQQRKEEEAKKYEEMARRRTEQEQEQQAAIEAAQKEKVAAEEAKNAELAAYLDNLDMTRPGGVMRQTTNLLTREGIESAQKTSSPTIDADQRLKEAIAEVGNIPGEDAIALLKERIDAARSVGLRETTPNLKRAVGLLGTLETAADATVQQAEDPLSAKMDAIFADGFAMPEDDGVDIDW